MSIHTFRGKQEIDLTVYNLFLHASVGPRNDGYSRVQSFQKGERKRITYGAVRNNIGEQKNVRYVLPPAGAVTDTLAP